MHFCFLINPADYWQQAVEHTYQLAKQANFNHGLVAVFFYGTSVHIAQDIEAQAQWHDLADCSLYLCRTMLDKYHLSEQELSPHFKIIGMAPWIMSMEQADRIVEIL